VTQHAETSTSLLDRLDRNRLTPAESVVLETLARDGVHVVHFWAPWCRNALSELRTGFAEVVTRQLGVTFTFVTVWNDGASGDETLRELGLADRVREVVQPDLGPSDEKELRRRVFLGLPLTWIPTTWIFHRQGELAFAFNYGEMPPDGLERALDAVAREW
jgi:hypothetical protein